MTKKETRDKTKALRYIELFGGIGGFRLGIQNSNLNAEPVDYVEIDKYSIKQYNQYFNEDYEQRDIKQIKAEDIARHDLLTAGFPCQPFSIAGQRKAFEDTRGTLFHDIIRVAKHHRPRFLFLENVKGLLSSERGRSFAVILSALDELGYDAEWQLLNSSTFGVPQNRERVFIIGHLREERGREIFPISRESQRLAVEWAKKHIIKPNTQRPDQPIVHNAITQAIGRQGSSSEYIKSIQRVNEARKNQRVEAVHTPAYTNKDMRGPRVRLGNMFTVTKQPHGVALNSTKNGDAFCLDKNYAKGITPDKLDRRTHIELEEITQAESQGCRIYDSRGLSEKKTRVRRLTSRECYRLQGFPDDYKIKVSDTQAYAQAGNAVTTTVIQAIANEINKTCA